MKKLIGEYDADVLHKLGATSVWIHSDGTAEYEGNIDISMYERVKTQMEQERQKALVIQQLTSTDSGMVRTIDDLIDVLVNMNVISVSQLPLAVQQKIEKRKELRGQLMI